MEKLINISELSKLLDLINPKNKKPSNYILRYWEKSFKDQFSVKRISNRRMFQKEDLLSFIKINELTNKGLNVKAIKKVFLEGELSLNIDIELIASLKEVVKILKT